MAAEESLEHFVARGHLVVRGALPRETVERWVGAAVERIRTDPGVVAEDYDDLRRYDPDDPATFPAGRITYHSRHSVPIERYAPRAWQATCALLGGPERVGTTVWGDHLLFSHPSGSSRLAPGPFHAPFHVDLPSSDAQLHLRRAALLTVVLLSDVAPGDGGTWIACDSVQPLVERLRSGPTNLDDTGMVAGVVRGCSDFVELSGEAGDAFLCHGLIAHGAPAGAGRAARVLTNPIIELSSLPRLDGSSPWERTLLPRS